MGFLGITPELRDFAGMGNASPTTYYWNDINSHTIKEIKIHHWLDPKAPATTPTSPQPGLTPIAKPSAEGRKTHHHVFNVDKTGNMGMFSLCCFSL